ncbi:hypothetical protein H5410_053971 [Solanum commersonii]|uniref:DOG1 domain-containing protein n=1 Tax=Solanum commersonii TaxID=4109 RepID=A0A9J5X8U0_SOLCO|nr:hypothetical protein H5410_053971 [Solanum commersonii]
MWNRSRNAMGDREGPRLVSSTALWRGDRRPAQVVQVSQLEQDFQRAPQQRESGPVAFDTEYVQWLEEYNKHINELRTAVNSHARDPELRIIVDNVIAHYHEVFRMKGNAAKADAVHVLSGMWKSPAERCCMWIGGCRPSLLIKLLVIHLEPLTEQQLIGIYNLQQSSHQAEDTLSEGMEAWQQSLQETLAYGSPATERSAYYIGQMAMAMGKLGTLEGFLRQADNVRQQTLQQMLRILTTRQSARALLAISEYFSRLRDLSSVWLARPREQQVRHASQYSTEIQIYYFDTLARSLPFDTEYSRWLEEHTKHINELRTAVNSHASEPELRSIVDNAIAHHDEVYRMKANAAKGNVEHLLSGMWKTPAERCFVWIGDFRPSLLLQLLGNQLEPLGEQQLLAIKTMQRTCHEAEDALSQGMQTLEQSLGEALANGYPFTDGTPGDVGNYMAQMAKAIGNLGTLEGFLLQADNLRRQTLEQLHLILTTRQSARALLVISGYFSRFRVLSSLWLAIQRDQ